MVESTLHVRARTFMLPKKKFSIGHKLQNSHKMEWNGATCKATATFLQNLVLLPRTEAWEPPPPVYPESRPADPAELFRLLKPLLLLLLKLV